MTPTDDLLKLLREYADVLACALESDRAKLVYANRHIEELARETETSRSLLESDRALLRRIVEAWDKMQARFCGDYEGRFAEGNEVIDEARARISGP